MSQEFSFVSAPITSPATSVKVIPVKQRASLLKVFGIPHHARPVFNVRKFLCSNRTFICSYFIGQLHFKGVNFVTIN